MKWPSWSIRSRDPADFMPALIGCVMLLVSLPAFLGVLFFPDRNSGALGTLLLILLGSGTLLGAGFLIFGVRICSFPGSLAYRLSRGRIFFH
jgi:hypothetical protein